MTRGVQGRTGSVAAAAVAAALLLAGCSSNQKVDTGHGVTSEGKPVSDTEVKAAAKAKADAAKAKAQAKASQPPVPKPPGLSLVVHDDCRVDGAEPVKLSKTSSTRAQWVLEGGLGQLGVEPGDPQDATASAAWKADVVVRCPGTAECFGELQPKCTVGDRHAYRIVINGKACPQTGTIEIVP